MKKGFTAAEVLVTVAILGLLAVGAFSAFVTFSRKEALDKNLIKVEALLEEARSLTISSRGDDVYGVHFSGNTITLFQGTTYNASASTNRNFVLPNSVTLTTTLAGGASDIVFNRLDGSTDGYGTTTLTLASNASTTKSIVIYKTGLIDKN